jgi:hypothetical protein
MIFLLVSRAAIIMWVTLSLMPIEIVFDAIEDEIERREPL